MIKYSLLIFCICGLFNTAKPANIDTTRIYLKRTVSNAIKVVAVGADFDFVRVLLPPDSGETLANVKEFYKTGVTKFVGKMKLTYSNPNTITSEELEGPSISFFPSGKRRAIVNYINGQKDGLEYEYYPDGKLYAVFKYDMFKTMWACNDKHGAVLCKDGNGQWLFYDEDFKNVIDAGPVKMGQLSGAWNGFSVVLSDTIKHSAIYDNGKVVSGTGFDKAGKQYAYQWGEELPYFRHSAVTFIDIFKSHLTIPNGANGKKMQVDSVHISFVVEKDGKVSDFSVPEKIDPALFNALNEAFVKSKDGWTPHRIYGIPLRSKLTIALKKQHGFMGNQGPYMEDVDFTEELLSF